MVIIITRPSFRIAANGNTCLRVPKMQSQRISRDKFIVSSAAVVRLTHDRITIDDTSYSRTRTEKMFDTGAGRIFQTKLRGNRNLGPCANIPCLFPHHHFIIEPYTHIKTLELTFNPRYYVGLLMEIVVVSI